MNMTYQRVYRKTYELVITSWNFLANNSIISFVKFIYIINFAKIYLSFQLTWIYISNDSYYIYYRSFLYLFYLLEKIKKKPISRFYIYINRLYVIITDMCGKQAHSIYSIFYFFYFFYFNIFLIYF